MSRAHEGRRFCEKRAFSPFRSLRSLNSANALFNQSDSTLEKTIQRLDNPDHFITPESKRPNFIFLLSDDQDWTELSVAGFSLVYGRIPDKALDEDSAVIAIDLLLPLRARWAG